MKLGVNINGGRVPYDPTIYRDLGRQAGGFGCGGDSRTPPPYRPDLYPSNVDPTTCAPQAILSVWSALPAGPYEIRADGRGELWIQFEGQRGGWDKHRPDADPTPVNGGWHQFRLDGSGSPILAMFGGALQIGKQITALIVSSDPADPVRNIRFTLPGEGEFRPEFLSDIRGFAVHRHLDTRVVNVDPRDPNLPLVETWDGMRAKEVAGASNRTASKVPLEDLCKIANLSRAGLWVCIPNRADAGYIDSMARLVDQHLDPSLAIYVEWSNEAWNPSFGQYHDLLKYQRASEPTTKMVEIVGRMSAEAVNRFRAVLKPARKCVRVVSGQAAWFGNGQATCLKAMESGGVDAIACAPYFGSFEGPALEAAKALAVRYNGGDATALDELFTAIAATVPQMAASAAQWKGLARRMGVPLFLYEAGQHVEFKADPVFTALYVAANRDARMGDLYTAYLDGMRDAGVDLAVLYNSHSPYGLAGSWGLHEWPGQPDDQAHKARAVRDWMAANPTPVEPTPEPDPEPVDPKPVDPVPPVGPAPDPEPDPEPDPVDPTDPEPDPTPAPAVLISLDVLEDAGGLLSFRIRRPSP